MKGYAGTTPTVEAIGKLGLTGNIIPRSWLQWLKFENGKPNSVAIMILSELCYWYRPIEDIDEKTGRVIGWRRKFKSDKLQKSYQDLADSLGFTKRQISDNVKWLESKGLVVTEFRHFSFASNVLFIDLCPDLIEQISFSIPDHVTLEREMGYVEAEDSLTAERETYTENTSREFTEITSNQSNNQSDKDFRGKSDLVTEPIESGKKNTTSEDKQAETLTTKSSPVNAFSQEVRSLESIGCAANFSKKEKSVALKYDDWGVLQLPRSAKYKLPSLLTIRTMQFLVAERCFGCQFGLEDDGTVWIYDSLQEEALTEDAAFGEDGVLPLKKLISVANSECSHVSEAFDAEWYNDTLLQYFQLWRDWCDRVGKRATEITKSKSVALLIDKLIEFDEDFFDDFEMPDIA